jgi:hypothetical protein
MACGFMLDGIEHIPLRTDTVTSKARSHNPHDKGSSQLSHSNRGVHCPKTNELQDKPTQSDENHH